MTAIGNSGRSIFAYFSTRDNSTVECPVCTQDRTIKQAVQAETLQGLNDSSQGFLLLLASDAELVEIQQKAHKDPDSLNEIEEQRHTFLERTRWLRSQNAFFQHQRGALGDADWETYARLLCTRQQSFWPTHKIVLADQFVSFVESSCGWQL